MDRVNDLLNKIGKVIFGVVGVIIIAYFAVKYFVG